MSLICVHSRSFDDRPDPVAVAMTGEPFLPFDLIGFVASFLPYPDNLALLSVHPELTYMIRPGLCSHIEIGRDVVEMTIPESMLRQTRSIYCGGTCHHDLRGLNVRKLRFDAGSHSDRLCEYATTTDFEDLELDNIENPVRLLRSLLEMEPGPRLHLLTLHLDRFVSFGGLSIGQQGSPKWRHVSLDLRFLPLARFMPHDLASERLGHKRFCHDVRLIFREVKMPGRPSITSMCEDDWKDWFPSTTHEVASADTGGW